MGMLRDLIDKNLDEISRRIDVPRSNIHQHAVTTEERLSKILWCLMNDQPAQGARQRLATVITDVIGKRWKKDVAKYIADIDIKVMITCTMSNKYYCIVMKKYVHFV